MQNRKVVRLLTQLPDPVRERLVLFLQSPYYETGTLNLNLYFCIEENLLKQSVPNPTAETIFSYLYPNQEFNANYFDKICAGLYKAILDFLMQEMFQEKEFKEDYLLEKANDLKLDEFIPEFYRRFLKTKESSPLTDFLAEWQYGTYVLRQPRTPGAENLQEIDFRPDLLYLSKKLDVVTAALNYEQVFSQKVELVGAEEMDALYHKRLNEWPVILRLRYSSFKLMQEPNLRNYENLLTILLFKGKEIPDDDKLQGYLIALNFAQFRLNEGEDAYIPRALEIYTALEREGLLSVRGRIPSDFYKNKLHLLLEMDRISDAEAWCEKWTGKLMKDLEGKVEGYCDAVLAFHKGELDEAIRGLEMILRDLKEDVYYALDARIVLLKAMYERNSAEDDYVMESQVEAARQFISRNKKVGKIDQDRYQEFIKHLRSLVKLRGKSPSEIQKKLPGFRKKLDNSLQQKIKNWFLIQLQKLER